MKVGALHHVAIAVPRLEEALPFYRDILGLVAGEPHAIAEQGVRAVFVGTGPGRIELIEPTDPDSGVARFLAERGRQALHHVCYEVDDLDAALADLAQDGIPLIDAAPRPGLAGRVAFLHPKAAAGVLIELVELRART